MSTIAIITARGGSKRIPRKNIKEFLGKPMLQYSIEAAINANCFDEIMVSTDDKEIADIAISSGAKIPFMRSTKNSNDFASTEDVLREVLCKYKEQDSIFDYCCCIYPTAPFILSEKLMEGYKLLINSDVDSVIPVTRFSYPIQRALKIENGKLEVLYPENADKRSQDLIPTYHDCGQFYWFNVERFLQEDKLFTGNSLAIEIPESQVQDIDNEEDWKIAEIKYKILYSDRILGK